MAQHGGALLSRQRARRRWPAEGLGQGQRRILQPMQRSAGNAEGHAGGDRTQLGDGLDGGLHELLSSLSTVARGIPNNDETFF